ncbi:hypothetical protein ACVMB1_003702 [Bradyrhizobium sp. USDA 4504]
MTERARVFVATPCYGGDLKMAYVLSALKLQAAATARGIDIQFHLIGNESLIVRARNELAHPIPCIRRQPSPVHRCRYRVRTRVRVPAAGLRHRRFRRGLSAQAHRLGKGAAGCGRQAQEPRVILAGLCRHMGGRPDHISRRRLRQGPICRNRLSHDEAIRPRQAVRRPSRTQISGEPQKQRLEHRRPGSRRPRPRLAVRMHDRQDNRRVSVRRLRVLPALDRSRRRNLGSTFEASSRISVRTPSAAASPTSWPEQDSPSEKGPA